MCGEVSKWGLRLVREPLLLRGVEGSAACLVPRLCLKRGPIGLHRPFFLSASVLLALCATSCGSSRQMTTNSSTELTTGYTNVTNERDSVVVEVHDTITITKTITVDRTEVGDTVRISTVTDRERVRSRDRFKAQEKKVEVRVDTVYVEKRDSTSVTTLSLDRLGTGLAQGGVFQDSGAGRASPVVLALKWIFFIIIGLIGLIVVISLKC